MEQIIKVDNKQLKQIEKSHISNYLLKLHTQQITQRLKELGAVAYDLKLPEAHLLPLVMQPNEYILGAVFGKYTQQSLSQTMKGRGALVITNRRVLLIDHKPLFMKCDEIAFQSVSGISYGRVSFSGTVVLHTKLGDISVRTFNQKCAHSFVTGVEDKILVAKEKVS